MKIIWWRHYPAQKYKNGNEKIIVSNIIIIIGILGSINIEVGIFFINKKDGDPITWFLIFFIFLLFSESISDQRSPSSFSNIFCGTSSVVYVFLLADAIVCVFTYFKLCTQSYVNPSKVRQFERILYRPASAVRFC